MIKRKTIVVGMTALAVVLSSGVIAFAAADTTISQTGKVRPAMMTSLTDAQREAVQQVRADSMEEAIAELVDSDTITQEEADKLTEIRVVQKENCDINVLTDEQRTALREEQKSEFESLLADLVDDGTLTQDQADQMEQGKGMMRGLDLTEEQKEAVMQAKISAMKEAGNGPAGILTEAQRTALNEAAKAKLESKLADLVDDGTLTQELADQLLDNGVGLRMGPGGKHGN